MPQCHWQHLLPRHLLSSLQVSSNINSSISTASRVGEGHLIISSKPDFYFLSIHQCYLCQHCILLSCQAIWRQILPKKPRDFVLPNIFSGELRFGHRVPFIVSDRKLRRSQRTIRGIQNLALMVKIVAELLYRTSLRS